MIIGKTCVTASVRADIRTSRLHFISRYHKITALEVTEERLRHTQITCFADLSYYAG